MIKKLCSNFSQAHSLFLIFQYIDGGSLDELLVKRSPLLSNWEARLNISMDIARGMTYLHSACVIHRDLASKVGNLIFVYLV